MNSQFTIDEDQELETQPIYLSSDESEIASPSSSTIPQLPNNVPNTYSAITQLIAAQHEQISSSSNLVLQYPHTLPTSFISDNDNDEVSTPIIGNPAQLLPYYPNCHPNPLHLCQQLTHIPDTPESLIPKNCGKSDIFRPYDLPNPSTSTSFDNPLNILAVADGLQNLALHPHQARKEWVTGCSVYGKPNDQVTKETIADYLNQTAQPGETVRERQIKKMLSLMEFRVAFSLLSPRECPKLPPVTA